MSINTTANKTFCRCAQRCIQAYYTLLHAPRVQLHQQFYSVIRKVCKILQNVYFFFQKSFVWKLLIFRSFSGVGCVRTVRANTPLSERHSGPAPVRHEVGIKFLGFNFNKINESDVITSSSGIDWIGDLARRLDLPMYQIHLLSIVQLKH